MPNAPEHPDVTLVTPTGDRPIPFALCEQWMAQQDYTGRMQWIVIDDGKTPTVMTREQQHIRRPPARNDEHTLPANLAAAIPHVTSDLVLIIEDDDYYTPTYITAMVAMLQDHAVVGQANNLYYRLQDRSWKRCPNAKHSSLYLTGMRRERLDDLLTACRTGNEYIDLRFWRNQTDAHLSLGYPQAAPLAVGIKGLPGRRGRTSGWRQQPRGFTPDPDMSLLRSIIGEDAEVYSEDRRDFLYSDSIDRPEKSKSQRSK